MYNLIWCSYNYSKKSGSSSEYNKDDSNDNITDSDSF